MNFEKLEYGLMLYYFLLIETAFIFLPLLLVYISDSLLCLLLYFIFAPLGIMVIKWLKEIWGEFKLAGKVR